MRVHETLPKERLIILKRDKNLLSYELWMLKAVRVNDGDIEVQGDRRIRAGGHFFTNLYSAAEYLLRKAGISNPEVFLGPKKAEKLFLSGEDLLIKGLWQQFCRKHKLNPVTNLSRKFKVTQSDLDELEVAG